MRRARRCPASAEPGPRAYPSRPGMRSVRPPAAGVPPPRPILCQAVSPARWPARRQPPIWETCPRSPAVRSWWSLRSARCASSLAGTAPARSDRVDRCRDRPLTHSVHVAARCRAPAGAGRPVDGRCSLGADTPVCRGSPARRPVRGRRVTTARRPSLVRRPPACDPPPALTVDAVGASWGTVWCRARQTLVGGRPVRPGPTSWPRGHRGPGSAGKPTEPPLPRPLTPVGSPTGLPSSHSELPGVSRGTETKHLFADTRSDMFLDCTWRSGVPRAASRREPGRPAAAAVSGSVTAAVRGV